MTFGSLFSGIGGIDLGLERAGMECRWQVEIDPWCRRVLAKHWPGVKRYEDVRDVGADNLEPVDLIAGGFPCQDVSLAGRRAGLQGERTALWSEFARIIRELRPRWVLAENVPGLLSSDAGRFFGQVLSDLAAGGYDAEWDCIPAAAVGAHHRRDRVFIVAYTKGNGIQGRVLQRDGCAVTRQDGEDGDMAHAESKHGERPFGEGDSGWESKATAGDRGGAGENWWSVEPNVGGTPYGLPSWMDGGRIDAKATETGAREILQALRDSDGTQALRWWPVGRFGRVQAAAVLQPALRESAGTPEALGNLSLESETAPKRVLRGVWYDSTVACPSCKRAARRQQAKEHPNALHILSSLLACDCGSTWLGRTGAYVSDPWSGDWEIDVPRVTCGIPGRVNRLRGLGNAVVPQVIEFIGRQIVEAATCKV